jgi:hypothetical protein
MAEYVRCDKCGKMGDPVREGATDLDPTADHIFVSLTESKFYGVQIPVAICEMCWLDRLYDVIAGKAPEFAPEARRAYPRGPRKTYTIVNKGAGK